MARISVQPYNESFCGTWNEFVGASRNATFLFNRAFMDYHKDRFVDASLLLYDERERLLALFPASLHLDEKEVRSHGGLTYGGFLLGKRAHTVDIGELLPAVIHHYSDLHIETLRIRPIPHIYHTCPSEEELYWFFRFGAKLDSRAASTVINLRSPLHFSSTRKHHRNKLEKSGLEIRMDASLRAFWNLLEVTLVERHGVKPVHTFEEIETLTERFPDNIRLVTAHTHDGEMLCGTLLFLTQRVAHSQYIAASPLGRTLSALDFLFVTLIEDIRANGIGGFTPDFFDFGISTESHGRVLNEGLIAQKELFGGSCVNYDEYILNIV